MSNTFFFKKSNTALLIDVLSELMLNLALNPLPESPPPLLWGSYSIWCLQAKAGCEMGDHSYCDLLLGLRFTHITGTLQSGNSHFLYKKN